MLHKHLVITGRVQGVAFRYYARHHAATLGLAGWVRNRPDGSVEAVIHGDDAAVASFISWAQHGPSSARVDHIDIQDATPELTLRGFRIED